MSRLRGSSRTSTLKPDVGNATVGSKEYLLFTANASSALAFFIFPLRKKEDYD